MKRCTSGKSEEDTYFLRGEYALDFVRRERKWKVIFKMDKLLLFLVCFVVWFHGGNVAGSEVVVVNKCCPLGQYYNVTQGKCVETADADASENVWNVSKTNVHFSVEMNFGVSWKTFGFPKCEPSSTLNTTLSWKANATVVPEGVVRYILTRDHAGDGLLLEERKETSRTGYYKMNLHSHHFCIDPIADGVIIRICSPECNAREPCLRKCCAVGEHFHLEGDEDEPEEICVKTASRSRRGFHLRGEHGHLVDAVEKSLAKPRYFSSDDTLFCDGALIKVSPHYALAGKKTHFALDVDNGYPSYFSENKKKWTDFENVENYCFERLVTDNHNHTKCSYGADVLYLCLGNSSNSTKKRVEGTKSEAREIFYEIMLVVAILSLFLTTAVLLALIEKQNVHTWARASYVISQLMFFLLIALTYTPYVNVYYPSFCKAFAVIFHFVAIMTMCWLSVINFDLWWTFRTLKPTGGQTRIVRRFLAYTCFALGIPLLVISIALGIQSSKPDLKSESGECDGVDDSEGEFGVASALIYPDYGDPANRKCTLSKRAVPAYWFGPLVILLLGNLIFFVTITLRMVHLRQMTKRVSAEAMSGRYSFQVFAKIFIVSGVTWNFEIIGWICNIGEWVILVHYLEAFALFVIFVCKREVIRSLQKRYPVLSKITPPMDSLQHSKPGTSAAGGTTKNRKFSITSTSGLSHSTVARKESFELCSAAPDPTPPSSFGAV